MLAQVLVNGLILGGLYACVAAGFSLVWGVLNVINLLHGTLVVLGGYLAWLAWRDLGLHPLRGAAGLWRWLTGAAGRAAAGGAAEPRGGRPGADHAGGHVRARPDAGNALLLGFGADYRTIRPSWSLGTAVLGGCASRSTAPWPPRRRWR